MLVDKLTIQPFSEFNFCTLCFQRNLARQQIQLHVQDVLLPWFSWGWSLGCSRLRDVAVFVLKDAAVVMCGEEH